MCHCFSLNMHVPVPLLMLYWYFYVSFLFNHLIFMYMGFIYFLFHSPCMYVHYFYVWSHQRSRKVRGHTKLVPEYGSDVRDKMRVCRTRMWLYIATKASLYVPGLASLQGDPEALAAMENSMFWGQKYESCTMESCILAVEPTQKRNECSSLQS